MIEYADSFGYGAAILTTIAFVPQLTRTLTTKSAEDISLGMLLLFITGLICWIVYAIGTNSKPVLLANLITLILNLSILILKIFFNRNDVKES